MISKLLILTDAAQMQPDFDSALLEACLGGAKWFCLREKTAPPRQVLESFARANRIAEKFGAELFLNGRADLARAAHAAGLQLPENEIAPETARLTLGFHTPIGVSVHDLAGAKRAASEGATYLLFGPVFATVSHPGQAPAGLDSLREIVQNVAVPVYAIGGIGASNAASCVEAGAAGVAAISAIWSAQNIAQSVRELRAVLGEKEVPHSHHAENPHGELARAEVREAGLKTGLAALLEFPKP